MQMKIRIFGLHETPLSLDILQTAPCGTGGPKPSLGHKGMRPITNQSHCVPHRYDELQVSTLSLIEPKHCSTCQAGRRLVTSLRRFVFIFGWVREASVSLTLPALSRTRTLRLFFTCTIPQQLATPRDADCLRGFVIGSPAALVRLEKTWRQPNAYRHRTWRLTHTHTQLKRTFAVTVAALFYRQ